MAIFVGDKGNVALQVEVELPHKLHHVGLALARTCRCSDKTGTLTINKMVIQVGRPEPGTTIPGH